MLKDKNAIITGGTRGIGKAIVHEFCKNGANVMVFARSLADKEEFLKDFERYGTRVDFYPMDISDHESTKDILNKAIDDFNGIDILVNNAGITKDTSFKKLSYVDWCKVIDINLTGVYNVVSSVVPHMIAQKRGKIVNLSSASAHGQFGQANYSASKAGILGLTKTLAIELAKYNINVNAVSPGFTMTEMTSILPEDVKQSYFQAIPLGRGAEPVEVAYIVRYLSSFESDFITGAEIPVDGGYKIY